MEGRRLAILFALVVTVAGCRQSYTPPFTQWTEPSTSYAPAESSDNAYDGYALAAIEVEARCQKYLDRNYFTPMMKQTALSLMSGALSRLQSASGKKCVFQFRPHKPGERPPYQKGWRLLGRALVWQIEQAVADGDYATAVRHCNDATAFGFDLVGGGALDASLGLAIVDEARRALSPAIQGMAPEQLAQLQEGITKALQNKPLLAHTFDNEGKNMLMAVQYVQDCFRDNQWEELKKLLDKDAKPAIEFLKNLQSEPEKRANYFQAFAKEAEGEVAWLVDQSRLPGYKRSEEGPELIEDEDNHRPWKRFSKHFFRTGRPLLDMELKTLARTRLLILEAATLQHVKNEKAAIADLDGFPSVVRTDPFTGRNFVYRVEGSDYRLYSVGGDHKDDGGETDETYTAPDLMIEKSG